MIPLPLITKLYPYTTLFRSLRSIKVSDDLLEKLVEVAMKSGALGAKLAGGGKGGCMIADRKSTRLLQSRPHLVCRLLLEKKNHRDFVLYQLTRLLNVLVKLT